MAVAATAAAARAAEVREEEKVAEGTEVVERVGERVEVAMAEVAGWW